MADWTILGGVLLVLLLVWVVVLYNRLIMLRNRAQNSWAQIDVQLKRRWDLVPNLVESVKAYALHEKQVLENVTKARAMVSGAGSFAERSQGENMLSNSLKNLFAVAEAYPQLQANANFLQVQAELSDLEEKIAFSRQFYNDTTMIYNTAIQSFPANVAAGLLGFVVIQYFEVAYPERSAVQVRF